MRKPLVFLLFFCFSLELFSQLPYEAQKTARGKQGMVVTPHPLASAVGIQILNQGGNAVDAIVGIQFAMAVVYPRAGNLGGGGFLVYRQQDGQTAALDFREKAPLAAHRDMYLDNNGEVMGRLSQDGHLAAGVPGTVAGLVAAHKKYGRLAWHQLINPAIQLAAQGFPISASEAARLNGFQESFKRLNTTDNPFIKSQWKEGDMLIQQDLAQVLIRIRDKGMDGFYRGKTAGLIVAEMKRGQGLITLKDLQSYQPVWRTPISARYKNFRVIAMPPSSSGGVALIQMLKMIEPNPLAEYGMHSAKAVHLMAEVSRRAYADRATYLGDMDFYRVPIDSLIDGAYLQKRMESYDPDMASASDVLGAGMITLDKESFETEHTSVVDAAGNAASLTTTLNSNYGCKVVVGGAGFFLNNEMDDFSVKPGVPNQFGLVGHEANAIAPGKRMLSSMTPTIIEKDDTLFMVLGAPGGSTIITAVFQVMLNVMEFGLPLEEAVKAGRFHHQWLPDQILLEEGTLTDTVRESLRAKGHQFNNVKYMAVIKAIQRLPDGSLTGAADPRNPDDDAVAQ
jgi:gamma-glutamyltranspeptidase / glutathione hydrolase